MSVFVLKDAETLVALQPAEFASEDDFQQLLAKFPSLLCLYDLRIPTKSPADSEMMSPGDTR